MNKTLIILSFLTLGQTLSVSGQNTFPASGNAVLGGFNSISAGRVYLQNASSAGTGWSRGLISQGVYWDNANLLWRVKLSGTTSDFSLLRFENLGRIGIFSRTSTGETYTMSDSEMEGYRRMTILTNGNVGIGIKTPTDKLAVNGNIRAKEVKVETANWPDYVFENGYRLPDLRETAEYIQHNKHLPGMPSANEIETEGLSLGDMNRKLLEKVEELTLQLIQVNERVKQLEKDKNK